MVILRKIIKKIRSLILSNYRSVNVPKFVLVKQFEYMSKKIEFLEKESLDMMKLLDNLDNKYLQEFDKCHIQTQFQNHFNKQVDFDNPRTFNEKIQYLKIFNRNPEMVILADKYRARKYLEEKILGQYLNKLYGVYNNLEEFRNDLQNLPEQFVLKVNHNSGGVLIVKDKHKINEKDLEKLSKVFSKNYYATLRQPSPENIYRNCEWCYKDIKPCFIVEKYIENDKNGLLDYRFFCFNGIVHFIQVDCKNHSTHNYDIRCFYDVNWKKQEFTYNVPLYKKDILKPKKLKEMIKIAEKLSQKYSFLRVDFYYVNDKIFIGELTFYPASGMCVFSPSEWDKKLGDYMVLD